MIVIMIVMVFTVLQLFGLAGGRANDSLATSAHPLHGSGRESNQIPSAIAG